MPPDVENAAHFIRISHETFYREKNMAGGITQDEPIFATHEVSYFGQAVAGLVCENLSAGKKALPLVKVNYEGPDTMEGVVLRYFM